MMNGQQMFKATLIVLSTLVAGYLLTGALAVLVQRTFVEPRQAEREYPVIDGGVLLDTAAPAPVAAAGAPLIVTADGRTE